jgi:hypothetical protein
MQMRRKPRREMQRYGVRCCLWPFRRRRKGPGTAAWAARRLPLAGTGQQPVLPEDRPGHAGIRAMADAVSGGLRRQATVQTDA